MRKGKLGIALGGGAARGWAHIGVMKALMKAGLEPDIVVGTSIGAVVGGCYVAGKLKELEEFARSLTRRRVLGFLDFNMSGSGLITGLRSADGLIDIPEDTGDIARGTPVSFLPFTEFGFPPRTA